MRHHRIPDPLAPLSERGIRRRARRDVQAQTSPIADALARHAHAGETNIMGLAENLAGQLGRYQGAERDIYSRAQKSLGDYNQQSADRLGAGQADALRARLVAAGQDPALADQLGSTVQGASSAGFTRGGAESQALIGRQAAAEDYGAKLPGIARLAGLQNVGERQARESQDLGDLQSKVPGLLADAIQNARNLEFQKATANLGFRGDIYKVQAQNARANAGNRIHMAAIRAANERTGMTLKERAAHNSVTEKEQAARDAEHARHNQQQEQNAKQHNKQQRRQQWWREHHKGKGSGGAPSSGSIK